MALEKLRVMLQAVIEAVFLGLEPDEDPGRLAPVKPALNSGRAVGLPG